MAAVDIAELERRVDAVAGLLGWHMGSIELADVSDYGTVQRPAFLVRAGVVPSSP